MTHFLGYFRARAPLTYTHLRFLINIPDPVNHVPFADGFESIFAAIICAVVLLRITISSCKLVIASLINSLLTYFVHSIRSMKWTNVAAVTLQLLC